ncbi:MAG: heme NO-binding domain-containing protein [Pseudomonadota bacterium]
MIGIIEKVLVDCLLEAGGDELREDVFFAAGVPPDRVYRMDQHYPDAETARLLQASLAQTNLSEQELFTLFTTRFFAIIDDVFPEFLRMCKSSEDLLRKQIKIHAIMAGGCRETEDRQQVNDKFQLTDMGPHDIEVRYKSELQLCLLYETLMQYAVDRFGDTVVMEKRSCPTGEHGTVYRLRWTAIAGLPTGVQVSEQLVLRHG